MWSVMQENIYQHRIKDVGELCECIVSAWDELDQRVIDTAVRQWRTRLRACIKAKGGYFEHNLFYLTLIHIHMLSLCAFESLPYVCCKLPFDLVKCPEGMVGNLSCIQCGKVWGNCGQTFVKFCQLMLVTYSNKCRVPSIMNHRVVFHIFLFSSHWWQHDF